MTNMVEVKTDWVNFEISQAHLDLLQAVREALLQLPIGTYLDVDGRALMLVPFCYEHWLTEMTLVHDCYLNRKKIEIYEFDTLTTCISESDVHRIDDEFFSRLAEWLNNREVYVLDAWDYMISSLASNWDLPDRVVPVSLSRPATGAISCQEYVNKQCHKHSP